MEIVCILCPKGCHMEIEKDQNSNWVVKGNSCRRGREYAIQEADCPMRTLTTSVWVESGNYKLVSVKTDSSIPRDSIPEALKEIAGLRVKAPIDIGDILLKNIADTGANLVATRKVEKHHQL